MLAAASTFPVVVSRPESWLTIAGEIAALVAAIAALITIYFARSTVSEARKTTEQLGAIGKATQDTVAAQGAMTEALTTAHREEMQEHKDAFDAELVRERLLQVERITELLLDLVNVARAEHRDPPPRLSEGGTTTTQLPAMLVRLHSAVLILESFGGPRLLVAGALAARGYSQSPGSAMTVWSTGINALQEIESLVRNHEQLSLGIVPGLAP